MAHGITASFWKGKRVFLTGHTGFKGSWLSKILISMEAEVHGYALAPEENGLPDGLEPLFKEVGLADELASHQIGDIRDRAMLTRSIKDVCPEIVIHMAAQPLVRLSYEQPVETYETNVMGTVHLLDACRQVNEISAVLVVSSDKCYENTGTIWGYRENDPMGGHDPYSNSKGCTELVTAAYRSSYFNPARHTEHGKVICSGRAGNVIGGGDWGVDRLIPDAMRAIYAGDTFVIRNPDAVRPWQHVLDPSGGYLSLLQTAFSNPDIAARGWNFGPGAELQIPVGVLADQFKARLGARFSVEQARVQQTEHEAHLLSLDCTAASRLLGWSPSIDMNTMVDFTHDWYNAGTPSDRVDVVNRQIQVFLRG